MTEENTERLVLEWFYDQVEAEAANSDQFSADSPDFAEAEQAVKNEIAVYIHGAESELWDAVWPTASDLLVRNGRPRAKVGVDVKSEGIQELVDLVRRAKLELARRRLARLRGNKKRAYDSMFSGQRPPQILEPIPEPIPVPPATSIMPASIKPNGDSILLRDALARWKSEVNPNRQTAGEWSRSLERFIELKGNMPVDRITVEDVHNFKDALHQVPTVRSVTLNNKTLPQIIAETSGQNVSRLSSATIDKHMGAVTAVLGWCERKGHVAANVAYGIKAGVKKGQNVGWQAYSDDELSKLINGLGQVRDADPAKYWLPLLALYTGGQLSELGQLNLKDIRKEDGVDFIDINADGTDNTVEIKSVFRSVPVHPDLAHAGFLDYVDEQRANGSTKLFPTLTVDAAGKCTKPISKWWKVYRNSHGVMGKGLVFQSFRLNFKDACRDAGVDDEMHDALTGHSGSAQDGISLKKKAVAIAKLRYEGLAA